MTALTAEVFAPIAKNVAHWLDPDYPNRLEAKANRRDDPNQPDKSF